MVEKFYIVNFVFRSVSNQVEIAFNNRNSLDASNIRAGGKTIIIVDGFLSDSTSPMSILTKECKLVVCKISHLTLRIYALNFLYLNFQHTFLAETPM